MSQSSNLYRLQLIDSQIDQVQARVREIEAILSNNAELNQAQENTNSAEQALQEARKCLSKTEETVQDQHIKINQAESVLYGGKIRNPKELQDLQNEVAALKRFLSVLEDRQLEAMLLLEDAQSEYDQTHLKFNDTLARSTEQQSGLNGELTNLHKTVERLDIERRAAISIILPSDLRIYEQLRQTRRGVAVAKVSTQVCGACGALLTPALVQTASSPNLIVRCTSCGRILYVG